MLAHEVQVSGLHHFKKWQKACLRFVRSVLEKVFSVCYRPKIDFAGLCLQIDLHGDRILAYNYLEDTANRREIPGNQLVEDICPETSGQYGPRVSALLKQLQALLKGHSQYAEIEATDGSVMTLSYGSDNTLCVRLSR